MIRAVLDTNVVVSGLVRRHPEAPSVQLLDAWRAGTFQLITSEDILDEVARTLRKPYFSARLTEVQRERSILLLRRHADIAPVTVEVEGVAGHPEDDRILAAAATASADYLVTGDSFLLSLGHFRGVEILSPRAFLTRIEAAAS